MKKFIVLYYAPQEAMKDMNNKSPEEMQDGMKPWMDWAQRCGDGLVDLGAPLGNGHKVTRDGISPSQSQVVGYSVLQAEDMEAAQAMLKDHPHLAWADACQIEVHEALPLPS